MGCSRAVLEQLDAQVVSVAREEAGLRLRLGQVLEVMNRRAGCFELGFSSLVAYALERCERSARWVEVACCLARRLEALPLLRRAVATGCISWSMAELLARRAQPQEEAHWLELAQRHTLRQMRCEVGRSRGAEGSSPTDPTPTDPTPTEAAPTDAAPTDPALVEEREVMCTLTCTLDREDAWLLEATRALLEQLGTRGAEAQLEALLAEGQGALLASLPAHALDLDGLEHADAAQQRWCEQLARWRSEAEERCEPRIRAEVLARRCPLAGEVTLQAASGCSSLDGWSPRELDAALRQLAAALAGHELRLSRLLWSLHRADGWRRLGYATETQYARERLGMSRSSVLARRALARRLEVLPAVAAALGRSEIGVEAALQLVRIATPRTELAWLERARQRTLKHLREEVAAALTAVRLSNDADCPPPCDEELERFQELERAVLSGRVWGGTLNRPQPGCTPALEATPPGGSRERSVYQPSLFGVHGGRIRATGSARHIRWELGSREQPCVRVEGRQRLAAA